MDNLNLTNRLAKSNTNVKAALVELKGIFYSKEGNQDKLDKLIIENKMHENRKNYLERMLDVASVPWTINQCLFSR
jgi:hypothetical protein